MELEEYLTKYILEYRTKYSGELIRRRFYDESKLKYFLSKHNIKNENIERIVKVSEMGIEE